MLDIVDGYLSLMCVDSAGVVRDDLKLPEGDLGKEVDRRFKAEEQFLVS